MMSEPSVDLTVLDRVTGELLDVQTATTESLAAYIDNLGELRSQLSEHEEIVQRELRDRMDHEAATKLRVGDWQLEVPGANAGTQAYSPSVLEEVLQALIMAGTISEAAVAKALKQTVTVTFTVPFAIELQD